MVGIGEMGGLNNSLSGVVYIWKCEKKVAEIQPRRLLCVMVLGGGVLLIFS